MSNIIEYLYFDEPVCPNSRAYGLFYTGNASLNFYMQFLPTACGWSPKKKLFFRFSENCSVTL